MFEFARIIQHSVNCAVHDQLLLHEFVHVTDVHVLQNPKLVVIGSMTEGELHVVLELSLPEPI